jgi:hypothetical protein
MMHISTTQTALETLLHAFHSQMNAGCRSLSLSIKHSDGTNQWIRGNLDMVFGSDILLDMEYHDLVILEHYNDKGAESTTWINSNTTLNTLIDMYNDQEFCLMGALASNGPHAYFLFKNEPMMRYKLLGNEVISMFVPTGAAQVSVMNNISGKLTCDRGLSHMIKL